jgi:hypothetical protein
MRHMNATALLFIPFVAAACVAPAAGPAGEEKDEESVGEPSLGAIVGNNALSINALSINALSVNALSVNALSPSALSPGAAASLQNAGEPGRLFRLLVQYTVGCALAATSTFNFSWSESTGTVHNESYHGELGLAVGWATAALDDTGKQMVSACLAARVNFYGVPVVISMRSQRQPLRDLVGSGERAAYPSIEGAFWGNLFSAAPYLRACHSGPNAAHSRAAQRDCATGHLEAAGGTTPCGMIQLMGSCEDRCVFHSPNQYYLHCDDPGFGRTQYPITVALP